MTSKEANKILSQTVHVEPETYKDITLLFTHKLILKSVFVMTASAIVIFTLAIFRFNISPLIPLDLRLVVFLVAMFFFSGLGIWFYCNLQNQKNKKEQLVGNRLDARKIAISYSLYDMVSFTMISLSLIYFIFIFMLAPTQVSGRSMMPTIAENDRLLIWHFLYTPKRDDIITVDARSHYKDPQAVFFQDTHFYLKRIVGLPGDQIEIGNGGLYINDTFVDASVTELTTICTIENVGVSEACTQGVIPDGYYIVMGDNRNQSFDSRQFGLVKYEHILGKAVWRIFPFNSMSRIGS